MAEGVRVRWVAVAVRVRVVLEAVREAIVLERDIGKEAESVTPMESVAVPSEWDKEMR